MKKTLIIIGAITVSVLIIIFSVNSSRNTQIEKDQQQERIRQSKIDLCLEVEYSVYIANWNAACAIEYRGDNCTLPLYRKEILDEDYESAKDRCIERYSN